MDLPLPNKRLVDSSIWIAAFKTGCLGLLLQLPNVCISAAVLEELRKKPDIIAPTVQHLLDESIGQLELDDEDSERLGSILGLSYDISGADFGQMLYVHRISDVCLYMRDGNAQRASANMGLDVRDHCRLVSDMIEAGAISKDGGRKLGEALQRYFSHSGRRRQG